VYIAQPPLYKVSVGGGRLRKEAYAFSDEGKDAVVTDLLNLESSEEVNAALSNGKATVQRFKGLGEMMPEQLCKYINQSLLFALSVPDNQLTQKRYCRDDNHEPRNKNPLTGNR